MMEIRYKLLRIPVLLLNYYNSPYATSQLHEFGSCCLKAVKHKKVCSSCGKFLNNTQILKGFDETHILTKEQQEKLKNLSDNQVMEIVNFIPFESEQFFDLIPYIKNSKQILPSISKGFKHNDFFIFYGFKKALDNLKMACLVKYVSRSREHLGYIVIWKENLVFLEVPFMKEYNFDELNRLNEAVNFEKRALTEINKLENSAMEFIDKNINEISPMDIKEEKKELLKVFLSKAVNKLELQEQEAINPFE